MQLKEDIMEKRLYRSKSDRMVAGVCAGLANYFNTDPTVIRILAIVCLLVFNVMALIAYLILAVVVPNENPAGSRHSD
jgi:phage shock protein PspC (stress-responsive transcriptional regulator)